MLESRFVQLLMILFFSGAVVALGAHDLTTKHLGRDYLSSVSSARSNSMAKELHGASDLEAPRASLSEKALAAAADADEMDQLGQKDRQELQGLLERAVP